MADDAVEGLDGEVVAMALVFYLVKKTETLDIVFEDAAALFLAEMGDYTLAIVAKGSVAYVVA